jgi:ADP-ribosyl-[dinitrogen reductase] hydrolase
MPFDADGADWLTPRPVEESYWALPRRLLVGAHPGSRSRAQAMDRLKRFLEAGVTCFIDLTEPHEAAAYESLLPFETPAGRRIEYLREPIEDHAVPGQRETMARILALMDGALDSEHVVYLHCRAGIGRSAMALGCWIAERRGGDAALRLLAELWQPSTQSRFHETVPETHEQADFVRSWSRAAQHRPATGTLRPAAPADAADRLAGAWTGLALGDALGAAHTAGMDAAAPLRWTQHTALALCLAESLLATGRCDARDQIERYLRWQREGHCSPDGSVPGDAVTADVARALATYQWRGLPMAGSHDPREAYASSLSRVLAAVAHAWGDPVAAVRLAAEASRTTHQSPLILDACRAWGATLVAGLQGQAPAAWLTGVPQTTPACWGPRPLGREARAALERTQAAPATGERDHALRALGEARRIALEAPDFSAAIDRACRSGGDQAALYGALVGTLHGLRTGHSALPTDALRRLQGVAQVDALLQRLRARGLPPRAGA